MVSALVFGIIASSSLVIGAAIGAYREPPERIVATALAFASGALITALAFELFQPAFEIGGPWVAGSGLLAGAAIFASIDYVLDEYYVNDERGFSLLAAVTLDGIPENVALGIVLIGQNTNPFVLLVAIFASNFPEALSGTTDMKSQGWSGSFAVCVWAVAAALLTVAVVLGNTLFAGLSDATLAFVRAFAGGAILASLADELMPDAYRNGGPVVAFATAAGFFLSFFLK